MVPSSTNVIAAMKSAKVAGTIADLAYEQCALCPRACGVNRAQGEVGICGASAVLRIGRAALHWWEEPSLVGNQGSGAVFFAHCPLRCVYCQNRDLACGEEGIDVGEERFKQAVLRLQDEQGAANINLVTPTHYAPTIQAILRPLRRSGALQVPVVYNTSSYETPQTLGLMRGVVDIYLADFKYANPYLAKRLSHAFDYPKVALDAIEEMLEQVGSYQEDSRGLLQRGVIVRHLVLPGYVEESLKALAALHARFGAAVRLSIMNQYTPLAGANGALARYGLTGEVSAADYERVLDFADALGFEDYFWQEGGAGQESFIPRFDGSGV